MINRLNNFAIFKEALSKMPKSYVHGHLFLYLDEERGVYENFSSKLIEHRLVRLIFSLYLGDDGIVRCSVGAIPPDAETPPMEVQTLCDIAASMRDIQTLWNHFFFCKDKRP